MSAVLKVENLNVTLTYRKASKKLVEDVSFEVHPGECLGILGESGSGKSMTVKSILGLLDKNFQVSGSAVFDGHDLLKESKEELRRLRGSRITMVLQNPMTCFDPLYRIGNQMAETFAAHTAWNAQEIRTCCLKILDQMQILNGEEVLEKYPHQLSGGMLQRIMIGIAMALQPELLIADEPTTAIDAVTQYEILEEINRLLELVGLNSSYANRYPHELSGGQLQRVCIARAVACQPEIILFDEAISSLDAHTQIQIMDLLHDLKEKLGLTYIFITHDLTSVTYLCDDVLFLYHGRITEHIPVSRIAETKDDYARKLLASIIEFN